MPTGSLAAFPQPCPGTLAAPWHAPWHPHCPPHHSVASQRALARTLRAAPSPRRALSMERAPAAPSCPRPPCLAARPTGWLTHVPGRSASPRPAVEHGPDPPAAVVSFFFSARAAAAPHLQVAPLGAPGRCGGGCCVSLPFPGEEERPAEPSLPPPASQPVPPLLACSLARPSSSSSSPRSQRSLSTHRLPQRGGGVWFRSSFGETPKPARTGPNASQGGEWPWWGVTASGSPLRRARSTPLQRRRWVLRWIGAGSLARCALGL